MAARPAGAAKGSMFLWLPVEPHQKSIPHSSGCVCEAGHAGMVGGAPALACRGRDTAPVGRLLYTAAFPMFLRLSPLLLIATLAFAAVPPGVPRDLARQRAAEISSLRYHVSFVLAPHAATIAGHEELSFTLQSAQPVLLDYRDGTVQRMTVNGAEMAAVPESGHLELPANKLRAGENTVIFDFTSAVAPAGKPITRYQDKDDGSEYIYTLFVPMDASMAFPCFDQPDLKGRFKLTVSAPKDWTVVSNTGVASATGGASNLTISFEETEPIPTYLYAFAAGPFKRVHQTSGLPGVLVRKSQ